MRTRLRTAALITVAGALVITTATPATAEQRPRGDSSWVANLAAGQEAGVEVERGIADLDPTSTFLAPVDDARRSEAGTAVPTGLLTLPSRRLAVPTDRIAATVLGEMPAGATATVDVRGRRARGGWTEWIPAAPSAPARLPEPASEVQGRLVLTGEPGASPEVRDVTFTAQPAQARQSAEATKVALTSRVFATREGLVGRTTANGHKITPRDHFVALPSRRALSPRGSSDYSVKVCAPNGRCAFAPVWDVGPWNTRDDYWNAAPTRQEWRDLPLGLPEAQAAYERKYNGGRDQFGRRVANPAGIDLADGLFWDALGLRNNAWVTVDYLWTGTAPLAKVRGDAPVNVLAAPEAGAPVVGVAAEQASVPVECVVTVDGRRWLRIGAGQYLDAAAVPTPGPVGACREPAGR